MAGGPSGEQAPALQQLAFQELAAVAAPGPVGVRRRADVWADDSGAAWRAAVQPLLDQVRRGGGRSTNLTMLRQSLQHTGA